MDESGDSVQVGDKEDEAAKGSSEEALAFAVTRYREAVAAMPGLVPEMVQGDTIAEIDAAAETARKSYSAISRRITEQYEGSVPTGNPARSAGSTAYEGMKPEAKIALGLQKNTR